MDRRTYESPMDWQYQDSGPVDPTSPFTKTLKTGSQSVFSSPTKPESRLNSFAKPKLPSSFSAHPPRTSTFQPQLESRPTAPPFLNPAFTTPRKPFDDIGLSEASGAEDSPALTDTSDYPNDTPELDRFADVHIGGHTTPSRIDKSSRYGRLAVSPKRHTAGRGEIRPHRALAMADPTRKRKRHALDKDVGTAALRQQEGYDSDVDFEETGKPPSRSGGLVSSVFKAINENPNTPYNLSLWIGFSAISAVVLFILYVGWGVFRAVQSDIWNASEAARQGLLAEVAECRDEYRLNECSKRDRPALKAMCDEWYECMNQDPEAVMKIKATVKEFADVINEFADALSLKAAGLLIASLLVVAFAFVVLIQHGPSKSAAHPQPATHPPRPGPEYSIPAENNQGYVLLPVQTHQVQHHRRADDDTDTDTSPPRMRTLPPPVTPSSRRHSPSKAQRSLSPVKLRRSPSKGY